MITLLFYIGIIYLFAATGIFALKAAWGLTKIILFVVAFPAIIVGLFVAGIFYLALPLLVIGILVAILRPILL